MSRLPFPQEDNKGNRPVYVPDLSCYSDTEALLVAEAAKDLPPVAYTAPVFLDDNDLPGDCGDTPENTSTKPSVTQAWRSASDSASSMIRPAPSKESIVSLNRVDLRPTKVSTVRSTRVAPSPENGENSPRSINNGAASVSSSTASMPTRNGGLDREDTVEMAAWRRRHGSGDTDDESNRKANNPYANWPTTAELDAADGLGGGLATSESTEDLTNLISIHQVCPLNNH